MVRMNKKCECDINRHCVVYYIRLYQMLDDNNVLSSCAKQLVAGFVGYLSHSNEYNSFSLVESFGIVIMWWGDEKRKKNTDFL